MESVWKDLQALMSDVVEQMNHTGELKQRTGGLHFERGLLDTIVVKKQSFPAVYLTLTRDTDVINLHYTVFVSDPKVKAQEMRETLNIENDQIGGPLFRNSEGESLTTELAVFYILRPFLHAALLIT